MRRRARLGGTCFKRRNQVKLGKKKMYERRGDLRGFVLKWEHGASSIENKEDRYEKRRDGIPH